MRTSIHVCIQALASMGSIESIHRANAPTMLYQIIENTITPIVSQSLTRVPSSVHSKDIAF